MSAHKRDRLGKGLGALLGEYFDTGEEAGEVRAVRVAAIVPNPYQPRREFQDGDLDELTASIKENGLLQPIVLRRTPGQEDSFQLIAGERRWRAVMRLGWEQVPALVREADERTMLVLALVENLQRSALSPLEEASAYQQLADEFDLSHQQVADMLGKDRSTVTNALRLLQLPVKVRELLEQQRLSAGHARALLGAGNDWRMVELARQAATEGWSVREMEKRVQRQRKSESKKEEAARDPVERRLEEALQRRLGTPVKIRRGRGTKGQIEVPFFNAEDFERVFELLAGQSTSELVS